MKIVQFLYYWLSLIFGLAAIVVVFYDFFFTKIFSNSIESQFTIGLLGLICVLLSFERKIAKQSIELELLKIKESLHQQRHIQLLVGEEDIHNSTITAIQNVTDKIRVTSFKHIHSKDTRVEYYTLIAEQLLRKNIHYVCAFNNGNDFTNRKMGFSVLLEPINISHLKKVKFFKYKKQLDFNLLIVDDKVAFIDFPKLYENEHIYYCLKIEALNNNDNDFIKALNTWYDEFIPVEGSKIRNNKTLLT